MLFTTRSDHLYKILAYNLMAARTMLLKLLKFT